MPVDIGVLVACEATLPIDNFNYTASPISANDGTWTDVIVTGNLALQTDGSIAKGDGSASGFSAYKNNSLWGPDFVVMATLAGVLGAGNDGAAYLYILEGTGLGSGTPNGYGVEWRFRPTTDEFRIKQLDAGVEPAALLSGVFQEGTAGDKWALVRIGIDIEIWWKTTGSIWTYMGKAQSGTYTSAKRIGLLVNIASINPTATLDDLRVMNIRPRLGFPYQTYLQNAAAPVTPNIEMTGAFFSG